MGLCLLPGLIIAFILLVAISCYGLLFHAFIFSIEVVLQKLFILPARIQKKSEASLSCRLDGTFLSRIARMHYESRYSPPRKAFDYYAARVLARLMKNRDLHGLQSRGLFYSGDFGLTLVSEGYEWKATLESYVSRIDIKEDPADSDFIKTKKEYFQREISIMRDIKHLPHIEVSIFCIIYHSMFSGASSSLEVLDFFAIKFLIRY